MCSIKRWALSSSYYEGELEKKGIQQKSISQ